MAINNLTEIREIVKDAYIYGFPMVDSYRIQHAYFVDTHNPEYKGSWNHLHNIARVFTPEDKAVQTPNSDTPYSMAGLDLRAEPMVLTVPAPQGPFLCALRLYWPKLEALDGTWQPPALQRAN